MDEINQSRPLRDGLRADVVRALMRWQDETQAYDEAVGEIVGLNQAERHCLSLLHHGPQTAGAIATVTGLTPAAVTALVDRLESRGFLTRARSTEDRRKVVVQGTDKARLMGERFYGAIAREGMELLSRYSDAELGIVLEFLVTAADLQRRQLDRLKIDRSARQVV